MIQKIGFCCNVVDDLGITLKRYAFQKASVAHTNRLSLKQRNKYLQNRAAHNIKALYDICGWLRTEPLGLRMFRISSDFFPLYTHDNGYIAYSDPKWLQDAQMAMQKIGEFAREHNIRLSFHPDQFTVLNSVSQNVRDNSLLTIEYHTRMAEYMGYYGLEIDDFCVNVHGGAKQPTYEEAVESWNYALRKMSKRTKKLLTLENDELAWHAPMMARFCSNHGIRMVLDVHHHWVATGNWVHPKSRAVKLIKETWKGRTPKIHFSLPQPKLLDKRFIDKPAVATKNPSIPIKPKNVSNGLLRAHSDFMWHSSMIDYARQWGRAGFDIQIEAKMKNVAAKAFFETLV